MEEKNHNVLELDRNIIKDAFKVIDAVDEGRFDKYSDAIDEILAHKQLFYRNKVLDYCYSMMFFK